MQYQARGDYRAIMPGQDALLHLTQQNAMDHSGGSAVSAAAFHLFFVFVCVVVAVVVVVVCARVLDSGRVATLASERERERVARQLVRRALR